MDISYKYWKRSKIFGSKRAEKLVEIIKKQGGSATVAIIGQVVLSNIRPVLRGQREIGDSPLNIEELTITDDRIKF